MVTLPGNGSQGLQGQIPSFPTHICSSKLYPIFHGGARAGNSLLELVASPGLSGCFPTPQQERDNLGRQFLLVYQAISIKEYQQLQSHPAPIPALHHQFAPCGWWDGMGEAEHLPWILPPNPASTCRNSTARSSELCLDTSPLILWFSSPPFPSRCFLLWENDFPSQTHHSLSRAISRRCYPSSRGFPCTLVSAGGLAGANSTIFSAGHGGAAGEPLQTQACSLDLGITSLIPAFRI